MTNECATELCFLFHLTLWIALRKCNAVKYEDDTKNGTDASIDTHDDDDDIDGKLPAELPITTYHIFQ